MYGTGGRQHGRLRDFAAAGVAGGLRVDLSGWLLTSIGALLLAVIFGRLSRIVTKTGGPYAYCQAGYGEFAGFLIAWGYWITLWAGNAAVAVALAGYVGFMFPAIGESQQNSLVVAMDYMSVSAVAIGVLPSATLAASQAPLADVAQVMWGVTGGVLVAVGAVIATFGTLNGFTLLTGQVPYGAALDRVFPASLGRLSRFGTPANALFFSICWRPFWW